MIFFPLHSVCVQACSQNFFPQEANFFAWGQPLCTQPAVEQNQLRGSCQSYPSSCNAVAGLSHGTELTFIVAVVAAIGWWSCWCKALFREPNNNSTKHQQGISAAAAECVATKTQSLPCHSPWVLVQPKKLILSDVHSPVNYLSLCTLPPHPCSASPWVPNPWLTSTHPHP